MVIVLDGSWQRTGILLSTPIIISYMVLLPLFFHGKVFGKLRHPGVSLSLFGQWHGIGFSREITCSLGALTSLIGVLCVVVVGRVDHLLLHCGKTYWLWCFVYRTFGISWIPLCTMSDFLFGQWNWLGKHSSHIWNLVPLCLTWCIWKERNQRTFEDLGRSNDQLLALFLVPFLIGLRLGDSHLVILFCYSLALCFFVISVFLCFYFSIFFCTFDMLVLLCILLFFEFTSFLLIKKKEITFGVCKLVNVIADTWVPTSVFSSFFS